MKPQRPAKLSPATQAMVDRIVSPRRPHWALRFALTALGLLLWVGGVFIAYWILGVPGMRFWAAVVIGFAPVLLLARLRWANRMFDG